MDIRLFALEKGEGTPLILLHGNGEDHSYFKAQIEYFCRSYRVIAIDTRGHGASPRGSAPMGLSQFALDLRNFMDERGIEKAHILGFSDGANIALLFALMAPERVLRLILNGGNLNPWGVKLSVQLPILLGYGVAACLSPVSPRAKRRAEILALMVKEPHISPKSLGALSIPSLVIAGDRDMIRDRHTRRIHESLQNAELCILPGDHFVAAKSPEAFNRAVEAFLKA